MIAVVDGLLPGVDDIDVSNSVAPEIGAGRRRRWRSEPAEAASDTSRSAPIITEQLRRACRSRRRQLPAVEPIRWPPTGDPKAGGWLAFVRRWRRCGSLVHSEPARSAARSRGRRQRIGPGPRGSRAGRAAVDRQSGPRLDLRAGGGSAIARRRDRLAEDRRPDDRAHPANPVPRRRTVAFLAGLLAIAVALLSGIERYDTTLFSIHMVQHVLLTMVAAPLIALGAPITTLLRAPPRRPATADPALSSTRDSCAS